MDAGILIKLSDTIRDSTLKRLVQVPAGYEHWKISPGALSFAETAKHIIDLDLWTFDKIKNPQLRAIETQTAIMDSCGRDTFNKLVDQLTNLKKIKSEWIISLGNSIWNTKMYDDRFDEEVTIEWIILRGNLDHEIHHRGQIAAYLRVLKDEGVIL